MILCLIRTCRCKFALCVCRDHRPSGMYNFIFHFLDFCNSSSSFFQFSSHIVYSLPLEGHSPHNIQSDHSLAHIAAHTDSCRLFSLKLLHIYIAAMNERERMRPKIGDGFYASLRKCCKWEGWRERERERNAHINERKSKRVKKMPLSAPMVLCMWGNEREWWYAWKHEGDSKYIFARLEPNPPLALSLSRKIPKW